MHSRIILLDKSAIFSQTVSLQHENSPDSKTIKNHNFQQNDPCLQTKSTLTSSQTQVSVLKLIISPVYDLKANKSFNPSHLMDYQSFNPDEFLKKCLSDFSDCSLSSLSEEERCYSESQMSDVKEKMLLPCDNPSWPTSQQLKSQEKSQNQGYASPSTDTMTTPPKIKRFQNKRKPCNCQKNQCLKKYCDCFKFELTCQGCNCFDCHNSEQYQNQRAKALATVKKRQTKIYTSQTKVCGCVKSQCRRDYCECFQAQEKCGKLCSCLNCQNNAPINNTVKRQKQ